MEKRIRTALFVHAAPVSQVRWRQFTQYSVWVVNSPNTLAVAHTVGGLNIVKYSTPWTGLSQTRGTFWLECHLVEHWNGMSTVAGSSLFGCAFMSRPPQLTFAVVNCSSTPLGRNLPRQRGEHLGLRSCWVAGFQLLAHYFEWLEACRWTLDFLQTSCLFATVDSLAQSVGSNVHSLWHRCLRQPRRRYSSQSRRWRGEPPGSAGP
ncbi:hypothetical protein B0H16DRAFT_526030 [Mycena metata]|uniref:Uncharacterized protein n=1 Tax=Mycena metata TaxID=1033252 RepID=A0AAD7H7S7_9AGAR|nr:hypothetical protein B0H16DRAFT_526030 [Mycena metata]